MSRILQCCICKEIKSSGEFHKNASNVYRGGYDTTCKECHKEYYKENREKIIAKQRGYNFLAEYGITEQQYDEMFESQEGLCLICSSPPTSRRLSVDHCHSGGSVRGLLCSSCNIGLGHFKDNHLLLQKAAEYLISKG